MLSADILEYAKRDGLKQAWLGRFCQFDMDIIDIDSCSNFRVSPDFHQKYDTIWIYEKMLSEYHILSWKIILDEAIRLLGAAGKLIIRTTQNSDFTIPMLKHFLSRHFNLKVSIDNEYQSNGIFVIVFNIERLNIEIYSNPSWTFTMLTNGKKDDVVIKFLKSIRENETEKNQIIISGPKKEIYDEFNVEYLDLSNYRDNKYAEISRKKNDIAKMAKNANILIAHDRYYLDKNFFRDFEKFGYDFDFLAVKQKTENDFELPYYCAVYEPVYTWGQPIDCQDKNLLLNGSYVNGGCMVFKTGNLLKIPFNDLLFWNQMEDVEITQEFISHSLIPRVNFISTIIATDDKSEKMALNYQFDVVKNAKLKLHSKRPKNARKKIYGIRFKLMHFKIFAKRKFPFMSVRIKFKKRGI